MVFSAMPLLDPRVLLGLPPLPYLFLPRRTLHQENSDTHTHNNTSFLFSRGAGVVVYFVSLVLLSTKNKARQKRDQDAPGSCQGCGAKDLGGPGQHHRHGAGKPTQGGCLQKVSHTTSHSLSLSLSLSLCLPSVLRLVLTGLVPSSNCGRLCRDVFAGLTAGVAGLGASGAAHAANAKELAAKADQRKKEMRARMEALRAEEANTQAEAAKAAAAAQAAKEAAASAAAAAAAPPQEG